MVIMPSGIIQHIRGTKMEQKKILISLGAIAKYYGRSQKTVKALVKSDNFPAIMVAGRWESNTELIDTYQRNRVAVCCEVVGE